MKSAGSVSMVTKSGTNAFHGNLFEFVRNYRFNARNFFATRRDTLKRNQFGGTLGGPIRIDCYELIQWDAFSWASASGRRLELAQLNVGNTRRSADRPLFSDELWLETDREYRTPVRVQPKLTLGEEQ
jgi:hypothetical protein